VRIQCPEFNNGLGVLFDARRAVPNYAVALSRSILFGIFRFPTFEKVKETSGHPRFYGEANHTGKQRLAFCILAQR
jgi:hypothetical protein